jgi:hypothetical protein
MDRLLLCRGLGPPSLANYMRTFGTNITYDNLFRDAAGWCPYCHGERLHLACSGWAGTRSPSR